MEVMRYFKFGFGQRRLVTTVYLIQLVLAVTVGLQVYQVLEASIGSSVSLEGLKLGNAHMVINDLLNVHGASLSPILGQVRWLVIVYLIIAAFIHSGTWYSLIHGSDRTSFWIGGATYFWRNLLIGIVIMVLFILLSILLWLPYLSKIQYWMEELPSEAPILWGGIAIFIIWSILCVFLFVASSCSKILLIRDGRSVFSSIRGGLMLSLKRTIRCLPILMLFLVIFAVIYLSHGLVDDWKVLTSSVGIFILFLYQQLIVWSKIALRVSVYKYLLEKL